MILVTSATPSAPTSTVSSGEGGCGRHLGCATASRGRLRHSGTQAPHNGDIGTTGRQGGIDGTGVSGSRHSSPLRRQGGPITWRPPRRKFPNGGYSGRSHANYRPRADFVGSNPAEPGLASGMFDGTPNRPVFPDCLRDSNRTERNSGRDIGSCRFVRQRDCIEEVRRDSSRGIRGASSDRDNGAFSSQLLVYGRRYGPQSAP